MNTSNPADNLTVVTAAAFDSVVEFCRKKKSMDNTKKKKAGGTSGYIWWNVSPVKYDEKHTLLLRQVVNEMKRQKDEM